VSRGGVITVEYTDDDSDDVALTRITADSDGDPATIDARDVAATPRSELNGAAQSVTLDLGHAAVGERFSILGTISDKANTPATAVAPGIAEVRNVAWAKGIGGTGDDHGNDIATLADGSFVLTGSFWGSATFGAGEPNQTTLSSTADSAVFVARFGPDGTLAWAKSAGGAGGHYGEGLGIAALADGTCVLTGEFRGSAVFGAGEVKEATLNSAGAGDVFVARYGSDGTFVWAKSFGGTGDDRGTKLAALADGSCALTGYFYRSATFGAGEANQTTLTSAGGSDLFAARLSPDGTLVWAKRFGGAAYDRGSDIATLADGSILLAGSFEGSADLGAGEPNATTLIAPGSEGMLLAHLRPDGALAWAKTAGSTQVANASGIAPLADGTFVLTGGFRGTTIFGAGGPNETALSGTAFGTSFVARYGVDGTLIWAKKAAGISQQGGSQLAALADGSCLLTGFFSGSAIYGAGEVNSTTLHASGKYDLFVARFGPDGTLVWAKGAGGDGTDASRGVAVLPDGSFLLTGSIQGSATLGAGDAHQARLISYGSVDLFIARYNADGGF
jgi:hypothetical protein